MSLPFPSPQPDFLFYFILFFSFNKVFVAKAGPELVILVLMVSCGPSPLLGLLAGNKGISLSDSAAPPPAGCPHGSGVGRMQRQPCLNASSFPDIGLSVVVGPPNLG